MKDQKYKESREKAKKKYYTETEYRGRHGRYSKEELFMIVNKTMPDRELADRLGVSVKAIHNRRSRLKDTKEYGAEVW